MTEHRSRRKRSEASGRSGQTSGSVVCLGALILGLALAGCRPQEAPRPRTAEETAANEAFLDTLRSRLVERREVPPDDHPFLAAYQRSSFPEEFHAFAITLYQPGKKQLRAVRRGYRGYDNLRRAINRLLESPALAEFEVANPQRVRIQIDFMPEPYTPVERFSSLSFSGLDAARFEVGVDGLRAEHDGRVRYFLPGDAFVVSVLTKKHLESWLRRQFKGVDPETLALERFRSTSFVSYGERWLPLYRGYPVVEEIDASMVEAAARAGVDLIRRTQKEDGRFQYYYDAARDSYYDHQRSVESEKKNPYYNIVRHSGTCLLLLSHFERYRDEAALTNVRAAIGFLVRQLVRYETEEGRQAAYAFFNRKGKLGGSGLALAVLVEYQALTGDPRYDAWARLLKEHLVSEIRPNGEFFYYHVYPGRRKTDRQLFSFYYPGEALLGLARYYKHLAPEDEKIPLRGRIQAALKFLLVDRPLLHADKFASLPSDSWLMMAIEELWDVEEMRRQEYLAFVFGDADTMVEQMYTPEDALYYDYVGSFYYEYGDHAYPDGARGEGLLAAYKLALKTGQRRQAERYYDALLAVCWSTYHLVNTEASTYAVARPDRTIGGIRLKLTRQWIRMDMIEHVADLYLGFLPYWREGDVYRVDYPAREPPRMVTAFRP